MGTPTTAIASVNRSKYSRLSYACGLICLQITPCSGEAYSSMHGIDVHFRLDLSADERVKAIGVVALDPQNDREFDDLAG